MLAGVGMEEAHEYAMALGLMIAGAISIAFAAFHWRGFENSPRLTKISRIILVVFGAALLPTSILWIFNAKANSQWSRLSHSHITMDVTSTIIARVHCRAKWLPSGSTEVYKPIFQDLFHDWVIQLTPQGSASQVIVSIQDAQKPLDNIRVAPQENVVISEAKPGWFSGFDEPSQPPDFYVRTVSFPILNKPATITLRRPIKSRLGANTITSLDLNLDRQVHALAGNCKVILTPTSSVNRPLSVTNLRFHDLIEQLEALLVQKIVGPVTTRLDPDEPYPPLSVNESEMVDELRCNSSPCTTMLVEMKEHTRVH